MHGPSDYIRNEFLVCFYQGISTAKCHMDEVSTGSAKQFFNDRYSGLYLAHRFGQDDGRRFLYRVMAANHYYDYSRMAGNNQRHVFTRQVHQMTQDLRAKDQAAADRISVLESQLDAADIEIEELMQVIKSLQWENRQLICEA